MIMMLCRPGPQVALHGAVPDFAAAARPDPGQTVIHQTWVVALVTPIAFDRAIAPRLLQTVFELFLIAGHW